MRRAGLWLFLIMVVSYGVAFSAIRGLNIRWSDIDGLTINDGVVLTTGERTDVLENETAGIEGIYSVDISCVSADVQVISEEREDVHAKLSGTQFTEGIQTLPKLNVTQSGDQLVIEVDRPNGVINVLGGELMLEVRLPIEYKGDITVSTVSGNAALMDGRFGSLVVKTVSGDIEADYIEAEDGQFSTTSGEVDLYDYDGTVEAKSVSGDIEIRFGEGVHSAEVSSTSGSINIDIPEGSAYSLDLSSTSGELRVSGDYRYLRQTEREILADLGAGGPVVQASTISGDIRVR